jgi:pimeloyl-ACP methyl ester carboxylesterase
MIPGSIWRAEKYELNDAARRRAQGAFASLSRGYTHYERRGPRGGKAVILIHGFSVPCFIWDPTFQFLSAAAFQVVRYDLFGRGYSDRPKAEYGMPLYLEQLQQLLDALSIQRANLIGLSMGGPIAAAFAVSYPERVDRLVLIGPIAAETISLGVFYRLAVLPGIGDVLFGVVGNEAMLNAVAKDFFDPASVDLFCERYRIQMEFRGFRRAILSTVRNNMLAGFEDVYAHLGQLGKRVLLIWGEDDKTVPFQHSRGLRRLLPDAEFMPVARCGHIPHFEQPELINPRLREFLS